MELRVLETDRQLDETIQGVTADMNAKRQRGWIFAVLVAVSTIAGTYASYSTFNDADGRSLVLPLLFGLAGLGGVNQWLIHAQQKLIIPYLASTMDLAYEQKPKRFLDELPPRLLPRSSIKSAEDGLTGTIDGHQIKFAEVLIQKTSGRSVRTLFRGIVVGFKNKTPMPAFFIAQKRRTETWFSRMSVEGLVEARTMEGHDGEVFGVWLSEKGMAQQDSALSTALDLVNRLEVQMSEEVRLFSATSNGEEMHIALSCRRDLFRVGGLLVGQKKTIESIKTALKELDIPLQIISVLREAEENFKTTKCTNS